MRTDIYGNKLRPGYCEIHPQVAEEYPCTLCLKEREVQQQLRKLMPNYILESQAQAAHQAGHALGLPAGTDITVELVPAIHGLLTAQQDHQRLVRELDVLLNGEEGAAQQASLCDLVAQVAKDGVVAKTKLHKLAATMENVIMAGTSGSRGMRNFIAEAKKALDEVKEVL